MKKLDLLLGGVLVVVCGAFFAMTAQLPEKSRVYPYFVTTLLLGLTLIHLFVTMRKEYDPEEKTGFEGFLPKQFFPVLILSGVYLLGIQFLGYIVSTIIYIAATLFSLKVDKKVSIAVSVGVAVSVYVLFKILLRVPLPTGIFI